MDSSSGSMLLQALKKIRRLHSEGLCHGLERAQADLFSPHLQVRHIVFMYPGLFRQVDLTPAAFLPQLPYSLSQRNADISCHPLYGGYRLKSSSTLSYGLAFHRFTVSRRSRARWVYRHEDND